MGNSFTRADGVYCKMPHKILHTQGQPEGWALTAPQQCHTATNILKETFKLVFGLPCIFHPVVDLGRDHCEHWKDWVVKSLCPKMCWEIFIILQGWDVTRPTFFLTEALTAPWKQDFSIVLRYGCLNHVSVKYRTPDQTYCIKTSIHDMKYNEVQHESC